MEFYDITHPISEHLATWPGDTPYRFSWSARRADGSSVNVGAIHTTVHLGTHADAPLHFDDAGAALGDLDLAPYLGPADLLDLTGCRPIHRSDLEPRLRPDCRRLLLRTGGWPDPTLFPEAISALTPDAAVWLATRGLWLLGVDAPSVDELTSEALPVHRALDAGGVRILEGLRLERIPEGRYEIIALPLRLSAADASPVRAILRTAPK